MTAPSPQSPPFAPLPVRARGTLEILDTGLKLFRRYFVVLVGWSLLITAGCGMTLVGLANDSSMWVLPLLGIFLYFFLTPFIFGAISCVVAAAVRGQTVQFFQVWKFTRPRYGALLGVQFVGGVVLIILALGTGMLSGILFALGSLLTYYAPRILQGIGTWTVTILFSVLSSLISCIALGWFNMSAIITCLEDNNRGAASLGRASSLMAGNIKRVTGVCSALAIFISIISIVFLGLFILFAVLWATGTNSHNYDWRSGVGMVVGYFVYFGLLLAIWFPAQGVITAVLYLDLRVKKEALDLEWTNYATAPAGTDGVGGTHAPDVGVVIPERLRDVQPASLAPGVNPAPLEGEFASPSSFVAGFATPSSATPSSATPASATPNPSSPPPPTPVVPPVAPTTVAAIEPPTPPLSAEPLPSEGLSSFAAMGTPMAAPSIPLAAESVPVAPTSVTQVPPSSPLMPEPQPNAAAGLPGGPQTSPQAGDSHVTFEPLSPLDTPAPDGPRL